MLRFCNRPKRLEGCRFFLCVAIDLCPPSFLPSGVPKFPYNFMAAKAPFLPASFVCQKSDKIVKEKLLFFRPQSDIIFWKTEKGTDIFPLFQSLTDLTETLLISATTAHFLYLFFAALNKSSELLLDNFILMQQLYYTIGNMSTTQPRFHIYFLDILRFELRTPIV